MNDAIFSACRLSTEDSASEFFSKFRCKIDIIKSSNKFDYSTATCKIGNTSVSRSSSLTGWSFEQKPEFDGLLIQTLDAGRLTWGTPKNKYESRIGSVFVIDQRDLIFSKFSPMSNYTTIFIQHEDIFQCLKTLLDHPPKSKIHFKNSITADWVGRFLANLADTALSLSGNYCLAEGPFLSHLKESLISFAIYNIENNYSQLVRSPDSAVIPKPHSIKSTIEYIDSHYSEALTSHQLSTQANISIRGLQAGFKKYQGTTINSYIREVRLLNARKMIFDSSLLLTTKQIALACGFSNYYLFCKYYSLRFSEHPQDSNKRLRASSLLLE
ncbi:MULTISPECIES: helix-turn-helix domain-containing protein [Pseudomonas]|uniref:AraC family transcriptional regulator n=1 Tax=Pseudomonas orientalis TaxID=76758 RepID=A0A4Q7CXG9_9PSED|nr:MULTISPECIES: AraC family transcriptional regulator [Pseudomonas]RZI31046.1 AraC family transcriptional regulator [Pseudomonas orientalis]CRM99449.1 Bacillibactin transport regulator [Pseudomonas sp. 34 E 7]